MNGKGDRDRTRNRKRYESNYGEIKWHSKTNPKKRYRRDKLRVSREEYSDGE